MRSARTTAVPAALLLLAACAQTPETTPEASGPGEIVLTMDYRPGKNGALYPEGALAEVIVRDASGREVSRRLGGGPRRFTGLAPGRYTVQPALRPCDGNCGYLDARRDGCSATVRVVTGRVRLHVTYRVNQPCEIHGAAKSAGAPTPTHAAGDRTAGDGHRLRAVTPPPAERRRRGLERMES
jgi:hypothetical protein